MELLVAHDLIYARMKHIEEPFEIARYNAALRGFGLPESKLKSFRIDMTGFSPQIAEELGDENYLDPNGVNRRFIIISPEQRYLPVVHTAFSNTESLMHQFFDANARAINAITIKDACYGEIEDNVYIVDNLDDLLSMEKVEFKVKTANDLTGKANKLRAELDKLQKSDTLWKDDAALNEMVMLAQEVGDIRHNEIVPQEVIFRHDAFWTTHFGGLYIFNDGKSSTVIGDPKAPGFRRSRPWQVSYLNKNEPTQILDFLIETGRIELPRGSWLERSGFVDHRIDMLLSFLIHDYDPEFEFDNFSKQELRSWAFANASRLKNNELFSELRWAQKALSDWSQIGHDELSDEAFISLVRAKPGHADQWLVNRLLTDYVRYDFVSKFIFNKPIFYQDYQEFGESYRKYVVNTLSSTYLSDKEGLRQQLFKID